MMSMRLLVIAALAICCVSGQQYDYQKKGYIPPPPSGATTCVKAYVGNTPTLCPQSAGVPLTDEGKSGSTVCVTAVNGTSYEAVLSLEYPAPNAIPWCTSNADCGTNPSVFCGTQGPTGSGNLCFPLAPSGCPFTGDTVNSTTVAAAGRRLLMV